MFAVFELIKWESSSLMGLFTDEGEAVEAGRALATRRHYGQRWWRESGSVVVRKVSMGLADEGYSLYGGDVTQCPPYQVRVWTDLDIDDRPVIEGSTSWRTEASYGKDDGSGRRCSYADNQYHRSVRRAARQVLRAYCR